MKIQKLPTDHNDYPDNLKQLDPQVRQLYVLGDLARPLSQPVLAVVGSRKVTPYGKQVTYNLARAAAEQGITVVSGLALGVDAIAHQAALDAKGYTIAVMPAGLDNIAPRTNYSLAQSMLASSGALISEYAPGSKPFVANFVARNRIVAGIADAVLITEAAIKSGTLHTANFALEQGKTVMAVPGNITSELSGGTNNLIKMGAAAVTDIRDILSAMNLQQASKKQLAFGDNPEETSILTMLHCGISDGGELLVRSKLAPQQFNQTITMLEINGKIRPLGAGHWGLA